MAGPRTLGVAGGGLARSCPNFDSQSPWKTIGSDVTVNQSDSAIGKKDAQKREIPARIHECKTSPKALETFEEKDLERMIRDVSCATRKNPPAGQR
jgi:hypothetical protein